MAVDVLIYAGDGNPEKVFGFVPAANHTFAISAVAPFIGGGNSFAQLGAGFVYRGVNTVGFDDTLVYSAGDGEIIFANDADGNQMTDPGSFARFGADVVFFALTDSVPGATVEAPALMIANGLDPPSPLLPFPVGQFQIVGDALYAHRNDGDLYRVELDRSATRIIDPETAPDPLVVQMFEFKGALHFRGFEFTTDHDFYRVDPVTNAYSALNIGASVGGDDLILLDNGVGDTKFYFWDFTVSRGRELYVATGAFGAFAELPEINPGSGSSYVSNLHDVAVRGDQLFFIADDGGADGAELWTTDGTNSGTMRLSGTGTPVGALSFLQAFRPIVVGDDVFFAASGAAVGTELFATDGTLAGTRLVADLQPGVLNSNPTHFASYGGLLYFGIENGPDDEALYRSNGTTIGTFAASSPIDPGGSTPAALATVIQLEVDNIRSPIIVGDEFHNRLTGTILNDDIFGLEGNDVLDGRAGADEMFGGAGNDRYVVDNALDTATDESGNDTAISNVISLDLETGQFSGIENAQLAGGKALNLAGDAGANRLTGNAGANRIDGRGGADTMIGGAGNDVYIVDSAGDAANEASGEGVDRVESVVSHTLRVNVENLTLTGANAINGNGNALGNIIIGNAQNNVINGRDGNDVLTGGGGADSFAFTTTLNGTTNSDRITDFGSGVDRLRLDDAVFVGIGPTGVLADAAFRVFGVDPYTLDTRVIYNPANGALLFDADGSGAGAAIRFAVLTPGTVLANTDFVVF